jgi:hypothetical protein
MEAVKVKLLGKVENLVCRILRVFSTGVKIGFDVHDERGKSHTSCYIYLLLLITSQILYYIFYYPTS